MATGGTVGEVEQQIAILRAEQLTWQAAALAADDLELDAMTAEQTAKDAQTTAHRLGVEARTSYHQYAELIDQAIEERRQMIPRHRTNPEYEPEPIS